MKTAAGLSLFLLLGACANVEAQVTTVFESLTVTASAVSTDSETEMDYSTSQWYCAIADGYLWENNSIRIDGSAAATEYGGCGSNSPVYATTANLTMSVGTDIGATYEMQTNHWLVAAWVCCEIDGVPEFYFYYDEYGYSTVSAQNFTGQGTVNAPGTFQETQSDSFYIATTYLTQNSDTPTITGVDVNWPADGALNSSGYTVLYGSNFTPNTQINYSGSGVSMSFTYISAGQVNIYYTISQSAGTGGYNLSISNTFGASSPITFTVGDPTPAVTGISPGTWPAGGSTPFTITGTGFGTSPTVSTSDSYVSVAVASTSNTSITGTATVNINDPGGAITVYVTSNGYGYGFQQDAPGQPAQGAAPADVAPFPAPQIWSGGNGACGTSGANVTGSNQAVVVGQLVSLCAAYQIPAGTALASLTWTVPGSNANPPTAIANYTANVNGGTVLPLTANLLSQQALPFYFVTPGNGLVVTIKVTLTNGASQSSSVTYTVNGVANPSMNSVNNNIYTVDQWTGCAAAPAGPELVYGNVVGPTPPCPGAYNGVAAVIFTNASGAAPGGGAFNFAQVIAVDNRTYTNAAGNQEVCTGTGGLDTGYPYPGVNNAGNATDAPAFPLPPTYASATRTFSATMYLLWTSNTAQSIAVPLVYQSWGFTDSANQVNGVWGNAAGMGGFTTGVLASNGTYPHWAAVSTEACVP